MKNIRLAKFGGTSLSDATCIQQAANVVQETGANLVVVSAVGGVTNALISLADRAATDPFESCMKEVKELSERHLAIAKELRCSREELLQITEQIEEARVLITGMNMLNEVSQRSRDRFLSIGEKLSSILMLAALRNKRLNALKVNAPNILVTDDNFGQAEPDLDELKVRAENHITPRLLAGHVEQDVAQSPRSQSPGGDRPEAALLAPTQAANPGVGRSKPRHRILALSAAQVVFGLAETASDTAVDDEQSMLVQRER